jgi:hypothetical protein
MANYTDTDAIKAALLTLEQNADNPSVGTVVSDIKAALAEPFDREAQVAWLAQIARVTGIDVLTGAEAIAEQLYGYGVRIADRDDNTALPEDPQP